ncbi:MAG TPA: pilus assembly protein TadG-related protein, partial [Gaiellaceae bacterium]|nr:pilus assembly protein TadG-related protein [Gaiellaceae bacterium]
MSRKPTAPPAGDRQSGQVVVITVLFLAVLLGMSGAVLDVGSWYRADRALQSTVDAAALAGAQALPDDTALANSLALEYAEKNGGGVESVSIESELSADDTILVTGARPAPAFFTKVFGLDEIQVEARAKVRASTIEAARWAAPFAVDERHPMLQCRCFEEATDLELEKVGPGAFRLINIDGSHGGTGPPILAEWIERGYEGYMPLGWYYSDPGAKFNSSHVRNALDARLDTEMLFPVYRDTRGGGANFEYEVVGWAGYVITSYEIKGSKNNKLFGYFTSVV